MAGSGTQGDPFTTLNDLPSLSGGEVVAIERGSSYGVGDGLYEQTKALEFIDYGNGPLPFFDLSKELPDADWSLASSQSNTYVQTQTLIGGAGVRTHILWQDGSILTRQSSVSGVESNPGSYYVNTASSPVSIYVHPEGSTNPSSDGSLYEWNGQDHVLDLQNFNGTATQQVIRGLHVRRPLSDSGALVVDAGTIEQVLVEEGGKHHVISGGGTLKDVVFFGGDPNRNLLASIGCVYFRGSNPGGPDQPAVVENIISVNAGHQVVSTNAHAGFEAMDLSGAVAWSESSGNRLAVTKSSGAVLRGLFLHGPGSMATTSNGGTVQHSIADGLGFSSGSRLLEGGTTVENTVVFDHQIKNKANGANTVTVKNCVIVAANKNVFGNTNSNVPILNIQNSIVIMIGGGIVSGNYTLTGDHCIFADHIPGQEIDVQGNQTLSDLQTNTGAFSNSVYVTRGQLDALLQGDMWTGDFRIDEAADVTSADGTVYSGQLPDGTSLSEVGLQSYWSYADRQSKSGALSQWPTPPTTRAEAKQFVEDPSAWDWQQAPHDYRSDVSATVVSAYDMDGADGTDEPDQVGSADLIDSGDNSSQSTSGAYGPARTTSREFNAQEGFTASSTPYNRPNSLWVVFPIYITEGGKIFQNSAGETGWKLTYNDSANDLEFEAATGNLEEISSDTVSVSMTKDAWHLAQAWKNRHTGEIGVRADTTETINNAPFSERIYNTGDNVQIGLGNGMVGEIGRTVVLTTPPQKADRDWAYNSGNYRSISDFQNRTITVRKI